MHQYQRLHGVGGIGIIRISGERTFEIIKKIFKPLNPYEINEIKGYTIKFGYIIKDNKIVDEVLVSYFKSPKSYTTENMCEINSHGGMIIMKQILALCLENGANLAEPGEFTKRAFLNGRIDLSQAESVIDIINAKSDLEVKEGIKQLEGFLSKKIKNIKKELLDLMTNIEVSIDYPEYDIPELDLEEYREKMAKIKRDLVELENSFDNGKIIRDGINTAIIGKPNAGKSSLLNAILKEERAIVTEYEGTTRDTIEEFITIKGIPLKLIDTAGIRSTENEIEKIGIQKSIRMAKNADLIIIIIDSSKDLDKEDLSILNMVDPSKSIILLNKIDLKSKINEENEQFNRFKNIIKISALKNEGIETLYKCIEEMYNFNKLILDNETLITNQRHKNYIHLSVEELNKAEEKLKLNMPIDIIEIYLQNVLKNLGAITGEEASEEIINEIFSRFCLGK